MVDILPLLQEKMDFDCVVVLGFNFPVNSYGHVDTVS